MPAFSSGSLQPAWPPSQAAPAPQQQQPPGAGAPLLHGGAPPCAAAPPPGREEAAGVPALPARDAFSPPPGASVLPVVVPAPLGRGAPSLFAAAQHAHASLVPLVPGASVLPVVV